MAAMGKAAFNWDKAKMTMMEGLGETTLDKVADEWKAYVDNAAQQSTAAGGKYRAKRTGHNMESVKVERQGKTIVMVSESGYGGWIEIDTKKRPATPYVRPGTMAMSKDLPKLITEFMP